MKYLLSLLIALFIAAGIQAQTREKVKIHINNMSDVPARAYISIQSGPVHL